jgi:hypothetical protein
MLAKFDIDYVIRPQHNKRLDTYRTDDPVTAEDFLMNLLAGAAHIVAIKHEGVVTRFIRWFADISIGDIPLVGGKNASLGEMFHELSSQGVKVPDGFAVTAEGYRHFLPAPVLMRAFRRSSAV